MRTFNFECSEVEPNSRFQGNQEAHLFSRFKGPSSFSKFKSFLRFQEGVRTPNSTNLA